MTYTHDEILSALRGTVRPRVYTDDVRGRILSRPYFAAALADLRRRCDEQIATVLPHEDFSLFRIYEEKGSRKEFFHTFEAVRKKMVVTAIAAWLFDDDAALTAAQDSLWLILNEYSWAPPPHISVGTAEENKRAASLEVVMTDDTFVIDLQAAECAASVAECILMLGERLHPLVVKRALFELERRIFKPFLERRFIWETKIDNWASVCGSNICLAALAVIDDEARLSDVIYKAFGSLERYLTGFAADGTCLEGLGYWNYGFGPYVGLAKVLFDRTGGAIDLFADPTVEKVARFYSKCFFMGKRTVSFADGYTTASFVPATHSILLGRYPDLVIPREFIDLGLVVDARLADTVRFFTETTDAFVGSDGKIVGTHIFPAAQWYVSSSESGIGIAAKGGFNAEPHNHNDVGSFQIYKKGSEIISDLGCGEYTKSYFGVGRYDCFAPSSCSHSLPIINGEYQKHGMEYRAKDTVITESGITMDIAPAYGIKELTSLVRSIAFDRISGAVTVKDRYTFKNAPVSVTERLVTSGTATVDGDSVIVENGKERMRVRFDRDVLTASISTVDDTDRHGLPRTTTVIDLGVAVPGKSFDTKIIIDNCEV